MIVCRWCGVEIGYVVVWGEGDFRSWHDGLSMYCPKHRAETGSWSAGHEPELADMDDLLALDRELGDLDVYCNWCGDRSLTNPCWDCLEQYESAGHVGS